MNKSESVEKLAAALCKAQGEMKPALRQSENPFFHSTYADLSQVWEVARPALAANGLSVSQVFEAGDGTQLSVTTILMHQSGQWLSGTMTLKPVKADPQGVGSCATYGRRYGLAAILGIVTDDDDDANAASGKAKKTAAPKDKDDFDNLMDKGREVNEEPDAVADDFDRHFPPDTAQKAVDIAAKAAATAPKAKAPRPEPTRESVAADNTAGKELTPKIVALVQAICAKTGEKEDDVLAKASAFTGKDGKVILGKRHPDFFWTEGKYGKHCKIEWLRSTYGHLQARTKELGIPT